MTTESSKDDSPVEPLPAAQQGARRNAIGPETQGTSPWRWLLVAVPLLVIGVMGAHLLGRLGPAFEQALREVRLELPESDQPTSAPSEPAEPPPPEVPAAEPEVPRIDVEELMKALGLRSGEEAPRRPGLPLPPDTNLDAREDAARAGFDARRVVALARGASPEEGARLFRMCGPCHADAEGVPSFVGPNLWGVVGRAKASEPAFAYSNALRGKGGTWSDGELAEFLHNPREYAPGTKMAFRGIDDNAKIASIIAYLRTRSDGAAAQAK